MAFGQYGVQLLRDIMPKASKGTVRRIAGESGASMARDVARFESTVMKEISERDAVAVLAKLDSHLRAANPAGLAVKYENMAKSPRRFLTGQPALMAHDMREMPNRVGAHTVLQGDMHLHNFGTVMKSNGTIKVRPIDFDEATLGPALFDVNRLATHVVLTGREHELGAKHTEGLVETLAKDYWDALTALSRGEKPSGKTPGLIDDLLKGAEKTDVGAWIEKKAPRHHGVRKLERDATRTAASKDQLAGLSSAFEDFRLALPKESRDKLGEYRVTDAVSVVTGTGSVGRPRYRVLIEGPAGTEPMIFTVKAQEAAALERVAPQGRTFASPARRGLAIGDVLDGGLDPYRGIGASKDGTEFLVERVYASNATLRVDELTDRKDFAKVVGFYGREAARAHAQGATAGLAGASEILQTLGPRKEFTASLVEFAHAYADQATKDHAAFVKALKRDPLLTKASLAR